MSYGRDPFYIYACVCDGTYEGEPNGHPKGEHIAFAAGGCAVLRDELAQFIGTLHWRRELDTYINRGYQLRPELYRGNRESGGSLSPAAAAPSSEPTPEKPSEAPLLNKTGGSKPAR